MTSDLPADRDSPAVAALDGPGPTPIAAHVTAQIGGTISGSQVAVGNGNMQVSTGGGDCIINQAVHRPPRPREAICVLPRTQRELVGRDDEVALALATVADREPVQFHGCRGAGKTALLRHLAHASTGACPEGIVYFRAAGTSLHDLLQMLFDFLFECEVPTKRTPGQLASDLARREVLFVLDDVGLDEDELETLLDTVPMSVFVLGSAERTLWSAGDGAELRGLSLDAALGLVEARLRRALSEPERAAFAERWRVTGGLPQQLVKDAERLRAATRGASWPSAAQPDLAPEDRELLTLTAALGGVPLGTAALAELSDQPDAAARLARLEARGLTQSHSPRFSATASSASLLHDGELLDLRLRLLAYFIDRAEGGGTDPARPRDDLDPIVALLRWGQAAAPHADVLRLARASDTIAAGAGLWDAWRTILDIGLTSARAIGDRDGEAWALHQLGTRALCLEESLDAHRLLREALRLRRLVGDRTGAANTQHNMRFLPGGPGSSGGSDGGPPIHPGSGAPSGAGPGLNLLAPASWPLCAWTAAVVLMIGGFLATASGTQKVRMEDPTALLRDRPVLSFECVDRKACDVFIACTVVSACTGPGPGRDPAPGHGDDLTAGGSGAPRDELRDVRWEGYAAGGVASPPRFHTGRIDGRRAVKRFDRPNPGPPHPDPSKPDPSKPDPSKPDPSKPDPSKPDRSKPDRSKPDPRILDPIDDVLNDVVYANPKKLGSELTPPCDHFAAIRIFIQQELGLPAKLLDVPALAKIVDEQRQIVRELIDGLQCGESDAAALLDRLLAPLAIPPTT